MDRLENRFHVSYWTQNNMNVRLKFRIRYPAEKKFYTTTIETAYPNLGKDAWNEPYEIQQFTGKQDIFGTDIYEGDIVKTIYDGDNHIGRVFWADETASFRIMCKKMGLPLVTYRFVNDKPEGLILVAEEVIGNIFENLELLK